MRGLKPTVTDTGVADSMVAPRVGAWIETYARKYALNGMFCIDDTKDSDATNTGDKKDDNYNIAIQEVNGAQSLSELTRIYNTYTMLQSNKEFVSKLSEKRKTLENAK